MRLEISLGYLTKSWAAARAFGSQKVPLFLVLLAALGLEVFYKVLQYSFTASRESWLSSP